MSLTEGNKPIRGEDTDATPQDSHCSLWPLGHGGWYERQATSVLLGVGLIVSFLIVLGLPFANEDLFVAFCSGRDTMNGLLGGPNRWSYTIPVIVWVDQSWLAHLAFYLSYVQMGDAGPILIKGLLVASAFVLIFVRCRGLGASPNASLIALTLGALALAPFANIRAHLLGMLLFVILAQLLTLPANRNRLGQIGSVLAITLWSNVHGSFMLGFFLLALRAFVELIIAARFRQLRQADVVQGESGETDAAPTRCARHLASFAPVPTDVLGWLIAVVTGAAMMAFLNPYGLENLVMPFRQFFGTERTIPWVDWLPLLRWNSVAERGVLRPGSAVPFLVFLGLLGMLLAAIISLVGAKEAWQRFKEKIAAPNSAMDILLPLLMIALAFKFQRLVVFAAPALVPAAAVLMTALPEVASERIPSPRRHMCVGIWSRTAVAIALLWVACAGFIFYRNVMVPLLPDNPLSRQPLDAGLLSQSLSYNFVGQGAAEFMTRNRLTGRIFCNQYLSDYLLSEVPGVEVFMDLRAHSAYPALIMEATQWLLYSGQTDIKQTLAILDRYGVEHVVLDTCDDKCHDLLLGLMSSKRWGCVYRGGYGCISVLTRADSPVFRSLLDGAHSDDLWYKTSADRTVAESLARLFVRGSLPGALRERLESVAQRRPDPDVYPLIAAGSAVPLPCLDDGLRNFFQSEYHRLAGESYLIAGGERSVVMSLAKVAEILEADACHCSAGGACETYATARKRVLQVAEDLRRRYRPF